MKTLPERWRTALGLGAIALLAAALYAPFFGNPRVFDDRVLFGDPGFFQRLATRPFGLELRLPAHFSLAFTEVVWGRIEAQRIVSLLLHLACAGALYRLLHRLLGRANGALALLGAAIFAIHPVAVYGAGYLAQRSIVLATLFSLLSLILFIRGLDRGSHADALSAALMYSLAILCKEHAILLPAVALAALPMAERDLRFKLKHAAIYCLACAPAAIFVILLVSSVIGIGTPYEAGFDAVTSQIQGEAGVAVSEAPWAASAVTQMGLFFRYLLSWLLPMTRWMSIDVRIDFAATASFAWTAIKIASFAACAGAGLYLLRRGGRAAAIGFGLLYAWVLFLVELSSVRFQEPFVLYRSYLWAPGILIALAGASTYVSRRAVIAVGIAAMPLLFAQAYDRLETFSSSLALWEDAAAKLEPGAPGGYRTLFQLGRELLYSDRADRALAVADRCIAQYPRVPQCYFARGTILLQLGRYRQAMPYLTHVIELDPRSGIAHHHRGLALQWLGERKAAIEEYNASAKLGFAPALDRLKFLQEHGGD